ncbi:aminotransferase class I/II-fold pyridoxal phosphate-dependent enzyme, partial [Myxococcota bacterium]
AFDQYAASRRRAYRRVVASAAGREARVVDPATGLPRSMLMFGSNNYLGLGNHPCVCAAVAAAVKDYGVGMGGPPLLNGYTQLHAKLEERLSALKHAEATLLFSSGFGANVGLVTAMVEPPKDTVVFDEYSHASFVDGVRMARVNATTFRHNDVEELSTLLANAQTTGRGDVLVGVEGVYSMDGDLAPLDHVVPLCRKWGALLVLDDAHATGVLGEDGSGSASHFGVAGQIDVTMGTFSKAFGVVGGFVSGSRPLIEYLRYMARPYVFSASLPPVVVAAVLAGLDVLEREPELRTRLRDNVRYVKQGLGRMGVSLEPASAIIALRVPLELDIQSVTAQFQASGIFVNSVEYPAVPYDQQRLRISLMATHTREDLDRLLECIERVWRDAAPTCAASDQARRGSVDVQVQ